MKLHALNSVNMQLKQSWLDSPLQGFPRALQVMRDQHWHPAAPMLSWVIEHPTAGIILVDAGEKPQAMDWKRYPLLTRILTQNMIRFPEPFQPSLLDQLSSLGIHAKDVNHIILTHLHQDHIAHLSDFPKASMWVARKEFEATRRPMAHLSGYWPALFPEGFSPKLVDYTSGPFFNFSHSQQLLEHVHVVPTPGHAPGHQSVILNVQGRYVVLAGDLTPRTADLEKPGLDMVSALGSPIQARKSKATMLEFVRSKQALYLPSHCVTSVPRLKAFEQQKTLA